jgi:hypothetical protein
MQNFLASLKRGRKLRYNSSIAANKAYNAKFTDTRE